MAVPLGGQGRCPVYPSQATNNPADDGDNLDQPSFLHGFCYH